MSNHSVLVNKVGKTVAVVTLWLFLCSMPLHAQSENFTILTEELPPYSYTEGNKINGAAVEVVREILRRVGHPDTIAVRSWSAAYNAAKTKENHVVFSTTRTEERERLFKWVGPILEDKLVFFARKGSGTIIDSLDDARKVAKIGTYKDDVGETFLKGRDFTNTESTLVSRQNAQKLAAGRVELWIETLAVGQDTARRTNVADKIEPVFTVRNEALYMAFSRSTPDAVIIKWQDTLDRMKSEGTYREILKRSGITE